MNGLGFYLALSLPFIIGFFFKILRPTRTYAVILVLLALYPVLSGNFFLWNIYGNPSNTLVMIRLRDLGVNETLARFLDITQPTPALLLSVAAIWMIVSLRIDRAIVKRPVNDLSILIISAIYILLFVVGLYALVLKLIFSFYPEGIHYKELEHTPELYFLLAQSIALIVAALYILVRHCNALIVWWSCATLQVILYIASPFFESQPMKSYFSIPIVEIVALILIPSVFVYKSFRKSDNAPVLTA